MRQNRKHHITGDEAFACCVQGLWCGEWVQEQGNELDGFTGTEMRCIVKVQCEAVLIGNGYRT